MLTEENKVHLKEFLTQNLSEFMDRIDKDGVDTSNIRERSYDLLKNVNGDEL